MNKSIYNLCQKVISTKLPQVKYFGMYRNQFNNVSKEREINYPAVLLEIKPMTFNQQLGFNQDAICTITLHIGMQIVNNVEMGDKMIDNSLEIIELIDNVNEQFDAISGQDETLSGTTESHIAIGEITRLSQEELTNIKSIWYCKVNYSFPIVVAHKTPSYTEYYFPTGGTSSYGFNIKTSGYTGL